MKKILVIYGCLGVLFACSSSVEKKNAASIVFPNTSTEQGLDEEEKVATTVNVDHKNETSDISSEEGKEPENLAVQNNNITEDQEDTNENELADVAVKSTRAETAKPVVAAKKTQSEEKETEVNTIFISIVPDLMKFDKEVFTVVAGQKVIIELDNLDGMQHNMVISKPGTLKEVGAAADALARDPQGAQKNYVPEIPQVLFATKLLNPDEVVTLTFTAPSEPGDYPFVCTFPGHWRMMNGIMKVTK